MKIWISTYGWLTMAYRIKHVRHLVGMCLLGVASGVQAAEESTGGMPDLEFLEFLGSFETDDGEWIDPDSLLSDEFGDLLNAAAQAEGTAADADEDQDNDDGQPNRG